MQLKRPQNGDTKVDQHWGSPFSLLGVWTHSVGLLSLATGIQRQAGLPD